MARIIDMTTARDGKNRAAPVAEKLAVAERVLAELEEQIAQCALDEAEGAPGAAARMAALNAKISAARADRHKLRQAHRLARELDQRAEIAARAKIRASQLAAFQSHMRTRDAAIVEIAEAAEKMATAYRKYSRATEQAVGVVPIGTRVPVMAFGRDGVGGLALGNLDRLIPAELFRHSIPDENGRRAILPIAAPPAFGYHDRPEQIQPAIEQLREADAAIVSEIKGQIARIDEMELAVITGVNQKLKETA